MAHSNGNEETRKKGKKDATGDRAGSSLEPLPDEQRPYTCHMLATSLAGIAPQPIRLELLQAHCHGGLIDVSGIEAGLQTVGWLRGGVTGEAAASAAATRGVEITDLSRFTRGPPRREGVQLGFAAVDPIELRRGVLELGRALEGLRAPVPQS